MKPRLSIVITCYNLGRYLDEALESIRQFHDPERIEVILVNDGSTEKKTNDVIKRLDSGEIIVLNQENMGLGKARNNGIQMAKGEYIIPLDADNKLRKAFIDQSIAILDENREIDVVYGDAMEFGERTGRRCVGEYDLSKLIFANYIDACACFRKKAWEKAGGYDGDMPVMGVEDWDFWLRLGVKGAEFKYVDEVFFDYRVRGDSMISTTKKYGKDLIDYIFSKPELKHLLQLKKRIKELEYEAVVEPSVGQMASILLKKIKRKVGLLLL